jgi:cytoskeletal protein CcmA (bactofilin family)
MSNRNNSSFSAADVRSYITNSRLNTFDQNTERLVSDISNTIVPLLNNLKVSVTGPVSVTGSINISGGVTGSVSVNNFPASFGVSGLYNGLVGVTGDVKVNGNVSVTGPISVENFPTTFGVSGLYNGLVGVTGDVKVNGKVSVTGPISVENFPTSFGVSGLYNGLVGVTGDVKVNGKVSVTGPISIENFPTTFGVSGLYNGLVGVTGDVKVNGNISVTGPISIENFPTTFGVSGLYNGLVGVTGDVKVNGKVSVTGPISVENFPATFGVSGLYNGLVGITGSLSTTITPGTLFGITGDAYNLLNTIETDISSGILVKGTDDTGARNNFYVDVNGIQRTFVYSQKNLETARYVWELDVNVISGSPMDWILDGRDREGWYFIGSSSDTLSWYSNSISSPPAVDFNKVQALWFIATIDNTSPTVNMRVVTASSVWAYTLPSVSTYFNGEKYLFYYGNKAITEHPELQAIPLTRSLISGPGANNENVTAINIVTGTSDGLLLNSCGMYNQDLTQKFETVFRDIRAQTAEDQLISLDFSGTNLNTVVNNALKLEGKRYNSSPAFEQVSVQQVGSFFPPNAQIALRTLSTISGRYWDGSSNPLYSELPVSVSITNADPYPRYSLSTTVDNSVSLVSGQIIGITGSVSLNPNQYIGITGSVGISTSANTIKFDPSNNSIKINDGTNAASVLPSVSNLKNYNGLVTDSTLYGLHVATGDVFPVTTEISGNRVQIEVRDNEAVAELTSIDTKIVQQYTTTNNSISGYNSNNVALSTYVIQSKTKSFKFNAFTANTATNAFIGSINSSTTFSNTNFGLANSRQFYVIRSGTTSATLSLAIDYIDALGNEQAAVIAAPIATTLTAITGVNGITINSVRANQTYTTNDTVSIAYANNINTSFAGGNFYQNNNSLFTCPNNAIAWVQNVSFYGQAADNLRLFKWTTQGVRETIYGWTNQTNFNASSSGEYGFGGYITAGETVGWGGENSSTSKVLYSTVIVKYF